MKNIFRSKGISRSVFLLGLVSLMTDIASEMIYPILPLFLMQLGAGTSFIGLYEGVAESAASITKYFSGKYSDRWRKKPLAIIGYSIANLTRPIIAFVSLPYQALALRFIDRIGKGIRSAPRDAWLASEADEGNRGKVFGFHRAMDHLGAAIGPLIAALYLYLSPEGYRGLILITAIPGFLAVMLVLSAKEDASRTVAIKATADESSNDSKISPVLKRYLTVLLIFTLGNSSDVFILLRLKSAGLEVFWIPIVWAGLHFVKSALSTHLGALSDRIGRKMAISIGWIIFAIVYLIMGITSSIAIMLAALILYGAYYAFTEGAEKAFVADLSGKDVRGRAFGLYNMITGIGALPASLAAGLIAERFGLGSIFIVGAVVSILSVAMLLTFCRREV